MDTRSKILTLAQVRDLPRPLAIAAGTFNPLRAAEAQALRAFRESRPGVPLLVVVLPADPELLPPSARAELAAALRVVDYVVIGGGADLEVDLLLPDETPVLVEHVRELSRIPDTVSGSTP